MKKKTFDDQDPRSQKILSLDIGSKRIGLALWNPQARLSRPLDVLKRKTLKQDLNLIKSLVETEKIEAFLVGMPYGLNEQITESTKNSIFWKETLEKNFDLPVYTFDESLSTKDAMDILQERDVKMRSKTALAKKDSFAAALILEEFIRAKD